MELKEMEEKLNGLTTQFAALSASNETLTAQNVALAEKNKELTQSLADTQAAIKILKTSSGAGAFSAFCDRQVAAGKVIDGERDALGKQYEILQKAEAGMQFAAGEKTLTQEFMDSIEARPAKIPERKPFAKSDDAVKIDPAKIPHEFAAFADGGLDVAGLSIDDEVTKYMAEHKDVTYEQAFSAVVGG